MPYVDPEEAPRSETGPDRAIHETELRARVHAALNELSVEEHEAISLCVLGGLTQAEASQVTGTNVNTIKARVRRGTERLRDKLKQNPDSLGAFLALPALPQPSGGLNGAAVRWVSVARNGGPTSYLPKVSAPQVAIGASAVAAVVIAFVFFALNPPGGGKAQDVARDDAATEVLPIDPDIDSEHSNTPDNAPNANPDPGTNIASDPSKSAGDAQNPDVEDAASTKTERGPEPDQPERLIPVSDNYPSGELRSEGAFLKTANDKLVHGVWKYYYRNGTLQDKGEYVRGEKHGTWQKYHPNSERSSIGQFVDGRMHGLWEYFRDDGSPLTRGEYVDGNRSGTWTLNFRNGDIRQLSAWQEGRRNGLCRDFDRHGTLVLETNYVDGRKNGRRIEYDPATRRVRCETTYLNDVKHGVELIYDPVTGVLVSTTVYVSGRRKLD